MWVPRFIVVCLKVSCAVKNVLTRQRTIVLELNFCRPKSRFHTNLGLNQRWIKSCEFDFNHTWVSFWVLTLFGRIKLPIMVIFISLVSLQYSLLALNPPRNLKFKMCIPYSTLLDPLKKFNFGPLRATQDWEEMTKWIKTNLLTIQSICWWGLCVSFCSSM